MEQLIGMVKEAEAFLDDCVDMCEALRCLQDKGVETVDDDGATLSEQAFDRCFPGTAWEDAVANDGSKVTGIQVKRAMYRGFVFESFRLEEESKQ